MKIYSSHTIESEFVNKFIHLQLNQDSIQQKSNKQMRTQHYKLLAITSFSIFLFTVLKIESIILLCLSGYFAYVYVIKTANSLTQKDLMQLLPKKMKKHIEEKSFADYIATLQIVKKTPMLNYFVPFLKQMSKDKKNQLQLTNRLKTTSAITLGHKQSMYEQTSVNETRLKMVRQPLSTELDLGEQLVEQTLKIGLQDRIIQSLDDSSSIPKANRKLIKQQRANLTTCQSTNSNNFTKRHNSLGKRKSSLVIKKKFAQESSSNEQPLPKNELHKRLHKSSSQHKLSLKNNDALKPVEHSSKGAVQPHVQNPIKTVEEYVKALIWMMKRLLGLRKMTSKIRRASMVSVASAAALFWLMVYFQIKMDKKKGKIIFKTLKALVGTLLVLSATGTTTILGYKLFKRITEGEQPPRRPQQFSLFDRK